jgi:hypothetical protein
MDRDPTQVRVAGTIGSEEIEITSRCEDGALALSVMRVRGHSGSIRAGFRLHLRNVTRAGLELLTGKPYEVAVSSPHFSFETLMCRSSSAMEARQEPANNTTARIDFMNQDEPVHLDGAPEILAEIELVPQFRD